MWLSALLSGCGGFHRGEPSGEETAASSGSGASESAVPSFARDIHPSLTQACAGCHASGASAGDTDLVLTDAAADDLAGVLELVDLEHPADSLLLSKAAGVNHAGGALFPPDSPDYAAILAWIAAGTPP